MRETGFTLSKRSYEKRNDCPKWRDSVLFNVSDTYEEAISKAKDYLTKHRKAKLLFLQKWKGGQFVAEYTIANNTREILLKRGLSMKEITAKKEMTKKRQKAYLEKAPKNSTGPK